jgi:hypothetical protein
MIWVYAICEGVIRVPPVRGRGQARLAAIAHGGLAAVVSRAEPGTDEATNDALHAHARVVDALMDEHTVLPARFGTCLADPLAVRAALAVKRRRLRAALRRVDGCVEIGIRATATDRTTTTATTGREYVRARLRDGRLAAALHGPLAGLAVASRMRPVLVRGELLRAAYLVPRAEIAAFCAATGELEREYPQVGLTCTGPWPAYSFAEEDEDR